MLDRKVLRFIFVGRLSREKGFHELLEWCRVVSTDVVLCQRFFLDVFGDGVLREEIESLAESCDNVRYHGHQDKSLVIETWKECDYTLIPSHFLETFGLSALDSLGLGKPVIAYKKGGLEQFGDGVVAIGDDGLGIMLSRLLEDFDVVTYERQSMASLSTAQEFTWEVWLQRFESFSGLTAGARILIVNDYAVDIGGLENWLSLMIDQLRCTGYDVVRYGNPSAVYGWRRFVDLLSTLCNIRGFFALRRIAYECKPDLVWFHSVHRRLGWFPLLALAGVKQQWRMFHDFGMMHPYPSKVHDVSELSGISSFGGFFRASGQSFFFLPLLFAKWCSLALIRLVLCRRVSRFFVPSPYLEKLYSDSLSLKSRKVEAFPLF